VKNIGCVDFDRQTERFITTRELKTMSEVRELFDLKHRVAIVTGGAGRLGSQMSDGLAEAGAHVVVAARNLSRCEKKAQQLSAKYNEAMAVQVDVTLPASVQAMAQAVERQFGKIDILVNAAYSGGHKSFEEMTMDDFESAIRGGLTSTFLCCQAVSRVMKVVQKGVIVNIGSVYGIVSPDQRIYGDVGNNSPCNYGAAKAGVIQFTRWLATYLAPYNIRVNCLTPGGFYNDALAEEPPYREVFARNFAERTPLGRMGNKTDLKGAVVLLASSASDYMTGHNLVVDGGWTAW
jgi:NAD(P)-dependent dehydrogenase (short-subunit alcohol dehydrogenase family)